MQILSAAQIRAWDIYTIEQEPIASVDLMERAALQCTEWLTENSLVQRPIKIFCGKGNNGGDGLAIACQLAERNIIAEVFIIEFGALGTDDFQQNLSRLHAYPNTIRFIQDSSFFPLIDSSDIIIDALFGSGVNRPLQGLSAELVNHINASKAMVVSVDVPSGMFIDGSTLPHPMIRADETLTFQCLKLCFLLPENESYFGRIHVLNIGLREAFLPTIETNYYLTELQDARKIYVPRKQFSHKGSYGHSLVIAGSTGKMGAAILCTKACLRSGAGLVTTAIDASQNTIMQVAVPEAMVKERTIDLDTSSYSTIGIGPGLGTDATAISIVDRVVTSFKKPMVIDADALNIFSMQKNWLKRIPTNSILTPHPKEFSRLFGECANDYERLQLAGTKAVELEVVIVLKGHRTAVACPSGKTYFNSSGNPGMATAGSGDVLTGILTALLSQGYAAEHAAILGVYLHGLAGDVAAERLSQEAMIAGDIVESLGTAFGQIALIDDTM